MYIYMSKSTKARSPRGRKSKRQTGGLLEALLGKERAPEAVEAIEAVEQVGGADSYAWHRSASSIPGVANARSHLLEAKRLPWEASASTGEAKRAAWIEEVRNVMATQGLNWRDALKEASRLRKQTVPQYRTVVERVKDSYTGRNAADVICSPGKTCPGSYDKDIITDDQGEVKYRPNAHNVSRRQLSVEAATNILRDYYRERASSYKKGIQGATKAMRQDISRVNTSRVLQSPCPTKYINVTRNTNDGPVVYQRRVVDKSHPDYAQCRSNWLYRDSPLKFDMEGIDAGEGKDSPAYGVHNLHRSKGRKGRNKQV